MTSLDAAAFLRRTLPLQRTNVAAHLLPGGEQVWLKKAGPRHGLGRYRLLGAVARLARLDVLRPVPNQGGPAAIATEARRLQELAAAGLRVPALLALEPDGLLMAHLGRAGDATPALADELRDAVPLGAAPVLDLWQQGLAAVGLVHARGACLSQAFARNLVRCPDGRIGYIDFEDDPAAALPLAHCQVRDALCYLHSTALYLGESGALPQACRFWGAWAAAQAGPVQALLADTAQRLRWLQRLPADRRFGRDLQRARAAAEVLRAPAH